MSGVLEAVCVVFADLPQPRPVPFTAIDKRPVPGSVHVATLGLVGDHVCDTAKHGGVDKAVYAYARADAARWADELGRDLPPGWFGENLRVDGVSASDAVLGQRWRVGGALLEVSQPRTPCVSFAIWAQEPQWIKRFSERGDNGTYLRVLEEGPVQAGDVIDVEYTPSHGVTVRDVFDATDADRLELLLATEPSLSPRMRERIEASVTRAARR